MKRHGRTDLDNRAKMVPGPGESARPETPLSGIVLTSAVAERTARLRVLNSEIQLGAKMGPALIDTDL